MSKSYMKGHIKAWYKESKSWKGGHYSLGILELYCKKGRLLDAGCGGGKYALPLRMRGFDVVAVDVSLNALKMTGERCASFDLDIGLLVSNIYQMPFSDGSFDVIWCYGVLQHLLLREREFTISEFRRLLRKDGLLFIEVMGDEDMRYGGYKIEPDTFSRKNGIVYHYFNKTELEELLSDFSYRISEFRKEKKFNCKSYTRHMISAVAKKT